MLTKPIPGCSIWWFSGHGSRCWPNRSQDARFDEFLAIAPDVDETDPRMLDLMTFWPWFQVSTKPIPGCSIWWFSGHGSRCWRNRSQDTRFDDFLAMAPNVDETDPRMLDLMIFWPWLQMSTKPISGCSIWWFSGHGSRCRRNRSQDARFNDFLVMGPNVDETDPRMLDLMIFWPWLQMSTKPIPGCSI